VINDSYNSNPVALEAMIEILAGTPGYRRRILAAGEMLELGADSPRLHREAGRIAGARKLDWVIAVQGHAEQLAAGATAAGVPASHAKFFANSAEAAAFIAALIEPGDLLLVKGSRGVKMERVVEALRAKYALAEADAGVPAPQGCG
jgi:UDP-N-acetylmuramoyl-tripeptide--D-alanyl-D-alanine ligase